MKSTGRDLLQACTVSRQCRQVGKERRAASPKVAVPSTARTSIASSTLGCAIRSAFNATGHLLQLWWSVARSITGNPLYIHQLAFLKVWLSPSGFRCYGCRPHGEQTSSSDSFSYRHCTTTSHATPNCDGHLSLLGKLAQSLQAIEYTVQPR